MAQRLVPFVDDKQQKHDGIYLDLDSGLLWYVRRHRGKLEKFSTGKTRWQLAQAKSFINEVLPVKLNQPKKQRRTSAVPYNRDELKVFFKLKESEGLDSTTIRRIKSTLKIKIEPFWNDLLVMDLSQESVDSWVEWYKAQWPLETMDNAIKYLRAYAKHLHHHGMIKILPKINDPDQTRIDILRTRKTARVFTPKERAHILKVAIGHERLAGRFMATMAARIEETLTLRFDEQVLINQDPPLYRWSKGQNKADHEGEHHLHESLIEDFRALYAKRKAEGTQLLFPQSQDNQKPLKPQQIDFNDWRKRAGLNWKWSSKTFRHTLLTELFNDPTLPQLPLCKQYRISTPVAFKVYVKTTSETMALLSKAVKV